MVCVVARRFRAGSSSVVAAVRARAVLGRSYLVADAVELQWCSPGDPSARFGAQLANGRAADAVELQRPTPAPDPARSMAADGRSGQRRVRSAVSKVGSGDYLPGSMRRELMQHFVLLVFALATMPRHHEARSPRAVAAELPSRAVVDRPFKPSRRCSSGLGGGAVPTSKCHLPRQLMKAQPQARVQTFFGFPSMPLFSAGSGRWGLICLVR